MVGIPKPKTAIEGGSHFISLFLLFSIIFFQGKHLARTSPFSSFSNKSLHLRPLPHLFPGIEVASESPQATPAGSTPMKKKKKRSLVRGVKIPLTSEPAPSVPVSSQD
ncbi:hypothetical protein LIER_22418 [Lithospermum erythrorhizon]|uniref:Uncharacterized protein n=1 Tax=Lithospermum erythrorhizon TaxID=34254 RepID=A0AAV3QWY6_LITER